jgi:hypothetical protein
MKFLLFHLLIGCGYAAFGQQPADSLANKPNKKFYEYMGRNVRFPAEALREGMMARIYAGFRIDGQGAVQDVIILNPEKVGYGFEEEVTKLLKKLPKQPVQTAGEYAIPVSFGYDSGLGDNKPNLMKGTLSPELLGQRRLLYEVIVVGYATMRFR